MNAIEANEQTLKQSQRLFNKYVKKGMRDIKKSVRQAQKIGKLSATVYLHEIDNINFKIAFKVRDYLVGFLRSNGFYVRKYLLGHTMSYEDEIYFAWGEEIERFIRIDKIQEQMSKDAEENK